MACCKFCGPLHTHSAARSRVAVPCLVWIEHCRYGYEAITSTSAIRKVGSRLAFAVRVSTLPSRDANLMQNIAVGRDNRMLRLATENVDRATRQIDVGSLVREQRAGFRIRDESARFVTV